MPITISEVRATRAYLAGFGTAGSLLAGGAVLFVLATAVVSYRGWPAVVTQDQPVAVVQQPRAPAAEAVRRVTLAASGIAAVAHQSRVRAAAADPTGTRAPSVTASGRQPASHISQRHHANAGASSPPPATNPSGTPAATSSGAAAPCSTGSCAVGKVGTALGGAATEATAGLGTTVSTAGRSLGSIVTGLTGGLGSSLGGVSPGLGKTVDEAGNAVGATVTAATTTLGNTVAGAGKLLGGALGALTH